jgi:hypothetical protein
MRISIVANFYEIMLKPIIIFFELVYGCHVENIKG